MLWAASHDRFGAAHEPAPRGAVIISSFSFCFLLPKVGIPQRKIPHERIFFYPEACFSSTPTLDGGWSFLQQAAFEISRVGSCS
jgi:hypothetical protein